jgi:hypothetical protein
MNDQNPVKYKQATRLLIGVCGVLFSIFSFAYLYVFQGDVIEALHYSLAHGRTHYSPLVGAVIITGVLLIFRWAINKLLGLKGPVRALAYFPSCLLLGVLTDVHRDAFHGGGFGGYWQWLLPLVLGVYVAWCSPCAACGAARSTANSASGRCGTGTSSSCCSAAR